MTRTPMSAVFTIDRTISTEHAAPQIVVLRIGTSLDFRTADAFKALCRELLASGKEQFILDFSRTGILDSTGLGALFSLHRKLSPRGGHVLVAAPSAPVQMAFQITRTHKIFRPFPTIEAALEALSGDSLSPAPVA